MIKAISAQYGPCHVRFLSMGACQIINRQGTEVITTVDYELHNWKWVDDEMVSEAEEFVDLNNEVFT